jgi:sulfate transport system permease protein
MIGLPGNKVELATEGTEATENAAAHARAPWQVRAMGWIAIGLPLLLMAAAIAPGRGLGIVAGVCAVAALVGLIRLPRGGRVPWVLTELALLFLTLFLLLPLAAVFYEALRPGVAGYFDALREGDTWHAIKLTLITAAIVVPVNVVFGVVAAWAIAKFQFVGKSVLTTLIDLPLAVSPVVAGLAYVLVFGRHGWAGDWLAQLDFHYPWPAWHGFAAGWMPVGLEWIHQQGVRIIYATPGIVLVTTFVTFPFVARELIPLMEAQGTDEEQAALVLGASGWQMFRRVTLPNIRWGLLYGIILCNARAMGEFGAVSVVSGSIRGETETIPLRVESLYNDFNTTAAFAVASVLAILAVVTLVVKEGVGGRMKT